MEIQVTINPNGDSELLALNTREDLFQDYTYFLNQAKATSTQQGKILLHKRFLRVALLVLLAYTEAVINAWLYDDLKKRGVIWLFKKVERIPLEDKMRLLCDAASATAKVPDFSKAKELRNLLTHFKPGNDGLAFNTLSVELVEKTFDEIDKWLADMEKTLGIMRHPDSAAELQKWNEPVPDGAVIHITSIDPPAPTK